MARRARRPSLGWLLAAGAIGFFAGAIVTSGPAHTLPGADPVAAVSEPETPRAADDGRRGASGPGRVRPEARAHPGPAAPAPPMTVTPIIAADPIEELRRRHLTLPVEGLDRTRLRDNFNEMRGGSRRHEAVDILAPRDTPVLAVEDGTVAKLFRSMLGGITLYQFDPTSTYAYYYAHLSRYADGVKEGAKITRGQTIGYVGTTGNAPPDTPHLHFAIFKLTDEKKWWEGTAVDPFPILK